MKKRIYIHAPKLPNTRESLDNICKHLDSLGLAKESQIIVCCSQGYSAKISPILEELPDHVIYEYGSGPETWEFPTLSKLYSDSFDMDFHCLYLHAKGASKTREIDIQNALAWQDTMLHGVVENYRVCVEHMNNGADLVGSLWHGHFKGNYWWSDSRYIRTLHDPLMLSANRLMAEQWCSMGCWLRDMEMPRIKNLFYLHGLETDEHFTHARAANKLARLSEKIDLTDKRLDPNQSLTVPEFLKLGFKCAIDRINIISDDYHLIPELSRLLNYDGVIQVVDPRSKGGYANGYKSIFEYFPPNQMALHY